MLTVGLVAAGTSTETKGRVIVKAAPSPLPELRTVIAQQHIPDVFDRYWQAKKTTHLGTGLGLSITKGIVEAHGGRIWVESRFGEGCSFYFTLPVGSAITDLTTGAA